MPFDFKNRDRIGNLIRELAEYRYRDMRDITEFSWQNDDGSIGNRVPQGDPETVGPGFRWKGWDQYNWLSANITVPQEWAGQEVIGLFDFGARAGGGNTSHFESLLYLNGEPYQGVDGNHKEVFLNVDKNGFDFDLKFRVWSGLSGGGVPHDMAMEICRAQYGILDHPTDDLYFLARSIWETYDLLDANNEHREWMLNMLVQAFRLIDYTEPRSQTFYDSVHSAYAYLSEKMDGRGKPDVTVSMLGHTHIDVAWLWRIRHSRDKAGRSFSTVNRMMEQFDDYVFLQSQAQLYDFLKTDYPEVYAHIQKRVAEGKWEPSGAMWVECDCNLASGESIVRQILLGKNFFKEEFGYDNEFLWLPDVFGYSWALPQILKKSGVNTFVTTKISWNDTNKLPYDTFLWKGIDGTAVTTHFVTTPDQGDAAYYTYNGDTRPYAVKGVWDNYANKDLNSDLLIAYGYGDGGGGPTRDMIKTIGQINKIPGLPHVRTETATSYFRRLNETLQKNEKAGYLPVWDGELYLEFHRGTYTSQAYNKKMNRRMEFALRNAEILSVLAKSFAGLPYDAQTLREAWKIVLCHQFHDILPGSSIKEVYEDSHVEYEKAGRLVAEVLGKAQAALTEEQNGWYTVFNNATWERDTYVQVPGVPADSRFEDAGGRVLESAASGGLAVVLLKNVKPFAFVSFRLSDKKQAGESKKVAENRASTAYYEVVWNERGQLVSLFDKQAGREIVPEGAVANELQIFEDKPRAFDAWELEPTIDLKKETLGACTSIQAEENELGVFVTFSWAYHKSVIRQTMCLYSAKKRIDFKTEVEWAEHQKVMKAAFPVNIRAVDARYDIQYGNIRRPITRNNSWESAKFEVVAHKWADMSETGYGLAVLNDCKYGHDIKEGVIRLTLLKSAVDPDYAADQGHHEFTYALLPHTGEWYENGIEQEAFELNNPLSVNAGKAKLSAESLLSVDNEFMEIDCVKQAEYSENLVVRFHEYAGSRGNAALQSELPVAAWCECDLMENPIGEWQEGPISLSVKPYEIKTVLLRTHRAEMA